MEDLRNKDKTIISIYKYISQILGASFFELPNFWDADNFAIGLKKNDKLIYISTWNHKNRPDNDMRYYVELEFIDENTNETKNKYKHLDNVKKETLIDEVQIFLRKPI